MNGKTHQVGGICCSVVVATWLFNEPLTIRSLAIGTCLIAGGSLGSLLPDIDHSNSKIRNNLRLKKKRPPQGWFKGWKQARQNKQFWKKEAKKPDALKHRGITHSPFLALVMLLGLLLGFPMVPVAIQSYYFGFALGLFTGIVSHILMDALTVKGVPLLAPMTYKKYRLMKLKTNQHEFIAATMFVCLAVISVCLYIQGLSV